MPAFKNSGSSRSFEIAAVAGVAVALGAYSLFAVREAWEDGLLVVDGDAEAHLNIARRLLDSRTPGAEQIGTAWLPLPHLLIALFVYQGDWWRSGLAGAIPSAAAFVAAGVFLFCAARRCHGFFSAAFAVVALFALSRDTAYLLTTPMTEMVFVAELAAMLWATLWYRDSRSIWAVLLAAAASNTASLTRYEGWFLVPIVALYLGITAQRKTHAAMFAALAVLAPLAWLAHNQYYYSNALEFYNGPWSAMAIHQTEIANGAIYPSSHSWRLAVIYYAEAIRLVAGWPVVILGAAGGAVAVARRAWWPLFFLALGPIYYVINLRLGNAGLYVPSFWPGTFYNLRYAFTAFVFLAFCAGALVLVAPRRLRFVFAALLACVFLFTRNGTGWLSGEAQYNSMPRRSVNQKAAKFLATHYRPGSGIVFPFGTLSGVLRQAGIPLREGLYDGNHPAWDAAVARPDMFLRERWAISVPGDDVSHMIAKAVQLGRPYRLRSVVSTKSATIEIYHLE
jgi:hypothetical protein